ncbi:MAG: hypothetical protein HYT87_08345 [Nitrospirae bacterium]|nr:hypothetical protein [Nitrospirota bacterium]
MIPTLPTPASELTDLLNSTFTQVPDEWKQRFVGYFHGLYGEGLLAVVLYGSYLSPSLRKPTSFPDFIVVAKERTNANRTWGQRILYPFLPPNALSGSIPTTSGTPLPCKYYVLAADDFEKATDYDTRDLAIAGRLSKRIAVIHASGVAALAHVTQACARSMVLNAALALPSFDGPFELDEFSAATLNVSYRAEFRMTEAGKVKAIFNAEAEFYRQAYAVVLEELRDAGLVKSDGRRWQPTPQVESFRILAEELIRRSRRNGKWRLVKYILLFRGWTRYLVDKIERSQGERIELTALQKRFPLIFAWGHFFRLLRQGRLR